MALMALCGELTKNLKILGCSSTLEQEQAKGPNPFFGISRFQVLPPVAVS